MTPQRLWRLAPVALALMSALSTNAVRLPAQGKGPGQDPSLPVRALARLGSLPLGEKAGQAQLAVTPDGRLLAVASLQPAAAKRLIHVLDARTNQPVHHLDGPTVALRQLLFSPDGKVLAASSAAGILLFEVATGKQIQSITTKELPNDVLRFTPDGKTLITGGYGPAAAQWDVSTAKQLRQWRPQIPQTEKNSFCQYVELSPNGRVLICRIGLATWERFHLYHADTGKLIVDYTPWSAYRAVAVAPDGKTIAVGRGWITLLNGDTGEAFDSLSTVGRVDGLCFTPDGKYLLSLHADPGKLAAWDMTTRKKKYEVPWPGNGPSLAGRPWSPATSQHAQRFWAIADGHLRQWKLLTGEQILAHPGHALPIQHLAFAADGRALLSCCAQKRCTWDAQTWKDTAAAYFGNKVQREGVLAVGWRQGLLVVQTPGGVQLEDLTTGQKIRGLEGAAGPFALGRFAEDERTLALVQQDGKRSLVRLYQTATGKLLGQALAPGERFLEHDAILDGSRVIGVNNKGVFLFDLVAGKLVRQFRLPGLQITGTRTHLLTSADRRYVHVIFHGRTRDDRLRQHVFCWEIDTGREVYHWEPSWGVGQALSITSAAVSPDNRLLALVHNDEDIVRIVETASGTELRRLPGHRGAVQALCFAPDGKFLASGSADTTVLVWDTARPLSFQRPPSGAQSTAAELAQGWHDLASRGARQAEPALWALIQNPDQAVPYLKARLQPIPAAAGSEQIRRWVADLDSDLFATRETAMQELQRLGALATPQLLKALENNPGTEAQVRIEDLLQQVYAPQVSEDCRRRLRALEVLERIGTPAAQQVLQALAAGAPQARQTQEAAACLRRLKK